MFKTKRRFQINWKEVIEKKEHKRTNGYTLFYHISFAECNLETEWKQWNDVSNKQVF